MYVCVCARKYVCMYVCMYACMYSSIVTVYNSHSSMVNIMTGKW